MGIMDLLRGRPRASVDRRLELVRTEASAPPVRSIVEQRVDIARMRLELQELRNSFPELVTADFTSMINRQSKALGDFSRETSEMRKLYRDYVQSEPTVKSALIGKVAAVVSNDLIIRPQDEDDPQQRAEAEFVEAALANIDGGMPIALAHWVLAGLVDGWSISEKVWSVGDQGKMRGRWTIAALKSKDTRDLTPITDAYRNVIGIESSKDSNAIFEPSAFLRMAYLPFFESPTGTSDLRAAVSYVQFKQQAIKLRMIYLDKFTGPYIQGEFTDKNDKKALETALLQARATGVIVTRSGTKLTLHDLATKGTADFKAAIEDIDKMIVVSVHGAFLHMLEGNNKDARGNSNTQERTTKGFYWLLAEYVKGAVRRDIVGDLIRYNFGPHRPVPWVEFESIDPTAVAANLDVAMKLQAMGVPISKRQAYKSSGWAPPKDEQDAAVPPAPTMAGGLPGGAPGMPGADPSQPVQTGQAAPVNANPLLQTVGGATSLTDLQTAFGRGEISREAAINNAQIVFGLDEATAGRLFLDVPKPAADPNAKKETAPGGGGPGPFDQGPAKFAEDKAKPGSEIALAGKDGKAAAGLMQRCIDDGKAAMELATRGMVERSLKAGHLVPFDAEESKLIRDSIASTLATSELLGRSRIREKAAKAEAAGGLYKLAEEQPFSTFADAPGFGGFRPLPPIEAANYFTALVPSLDLDARAFAAAAERQAFTLAAATEDVLLRRVRDSLQANMVSGGRGGGFRDVQEILDAAGVSTSNPQYAEMVQRTNMMDAYNVGAQRELQAPDMQDVFKVFQYLGVDDGRQGSDHAPHFGKYYPSDKVSFEQVRGKRVFNCRCVIPGQMIAGNIRGASKAIYAGQTVEIHTANGGRLTVTPNHPVLTENGFVDASKLKPGDHLVNYGLSADALLLSGNEEYRPSLIEDVFDAIAILAGRPLLADASGFDFHGDGRSIQGKVEIVRTNGDLLQYGKIPLLQGIGKDGFLRGDMSLPVESRDGPLDPALQGKNVAGGSVDQVGSDLSLFVPAHAGESMGGGLLKGTDRDAAPLEVVTNKLSIAPECLGYEGKRLPAGISFDRIVNINLGHWNGPVYDLESDIGFYAAGFQKGSGFQGLIVHNCTFNPIDRWTWEEDLVPAGAVLETSW